MTAQLITLADEDMLLADAMELAKKAGMFLIGNGQRAVISPTIPDGWNKIGENDKTARTFAAKSTSTPSKAPQGGELVREKSRFAGLTNFVFCTGDSNPFAHFPAGTRFHPLKAGKHSR